MARKLSKADRDAVDLMFNRIAAAAQDGSAASAGGGAGAGAEGFIAMAGGVDADRLQSVEGILNVLEMMPAADPPADLAVRTLQHIARQTGAPALPAGTGGFAGPHASA
jgi:hypothetical protein